MRERNRGFTLVELLIAMSLFVVLSTALIALLTKSFDFLTSGTSGTEAADKATDFLRPFRADLESVVVERQTEPGTESRIRFLCDFLPVDSENDNSVDLFTQRLAFVRSTREELADPISRVAGTKPSPRAFIDGQGDREEADAGELRAPGGMMEVLYAAVPADPNDPGTLTLYRLTRSPVGGAGSLLDPKTVRTAADVIRLGQPFLTGVLHFGVEFEAPDPQKAAASGPIVTWDSTRGILKPGVGVDRFPFARGEESLLDPRDDISPRAAIVTFVFERTGRENEEAVLTDALTEGARSLSASSTVFANTSNEQFVKVGTEWVRWANRTVGDFGGLTRGERGTTALKHPAGERVRAGFTVRRTIVIPAYREDYNLGAR